LSNFLLILEFFWEHFHVDFFGSKFTLILKSFMSNFWCKKREGRSPKKTRPAAARGGGGRGSYE
jgi:hypothetical protein